MTSIDFRAWHVGLDRWVYFTLEDALYQKVFSADRSEWWHIDDAAALTNEGRGTGLRDVNGALIYEGDILLVPRRDRRMLTKYPLVVRWSHSGSRVGFNISAQYVSKYAVVGNVHENADLARVAS